MAHDVLDWSLENRKMAEETCLLKEDGYLNADTDLKQIVYHPTLNVILICTKAGIVKVLDVNSGFVLASSSLAAKDQKNLFCRYISGLDRILFCDGHSLGARSDYNGVLLLDTILQKAVSSAREEAKLELLLSEAIILKQCLTNAISSSSSLDYVVNELTSKIIEAQKQYKKGIKAQKWNIVCLELPLEFLRIVTGNMMAYLMMKNQNNPEISVASSIQERVSELLGETMHPSDRRAMASEAKRRETFADWPHMDYKWALPDQMAQAGFYHQPNSAGDDRAMCFTCTVCLVCWERTDEPWSEHERHSPTCPFVMGEYTQNVPLSVTYATNPAIDATYRGVNVNRLSTSSVSNLIATSNGDGLISVFDVCGKLKRTHTFYVKPYDSHLLDKYTQDFGLPGIGKDGFDNSGIEKEITALTIVGKSKQSGSVSIRPSVICGLMIRQNEKKPEEQCGGGGGAAVELMEVDDSNDGKFFNGNSCLYLVVYDFQYTKDTDMEPADFKADETIKPENISKKLLIPILDSEIINQDLEQYIIQHFTPGEDEDTFLTSPPVEKSHSGPRLLLINHSQSSETDSAQATSLIIPQEFNSFPNETLVKASDKSISDHIAELQNSNSGKKLNYSRPVQCVSIPMPYKTRADLTISEIIPTTDGNHILVVLKSSSCERNSVLLLYALNFQARMVKLHEEPIMIRELTPDEKPLEVSIISNNDKNVENVFTKGPDGLVVIVGEDGAVRILELQMLKTISMAQLESEKFVSAVYCNSLERLCASTEKGSLHFYALNDVDSDSTEEHDEDDLSNLNESVPLSAQFSDCLDGTEMNRCFYDPPEVVSFAELKRLRSLCEFECFKGGYNPVVPPCWSEMQRQRRHPQHLLKDKDQITKSFRLQTDTTTWDEHIFEITLPSSLNIGHVDVSFTLHSCMPKVEFTLLRQNTASIGLRKEVKFAVDDSVNFDQLQSLQNPVTSQEYLRAHNAEILAGPVAIDTCLDLTELSGCVCLTSPKLFKSRNRNILLHMKSVGSIDELKGTKIKRGIGGSGSDYMGCDALHEITISVYNSTHTEIPHGKTQRCSMLESNAFVHSLLLTIIESPCVEERNAALDILNWVACIRVTRSRNHNGEVPAQQIEFINIIHKYLTGLLRSCILEMGRSISHKCAKLIVICSDGASLMSDELNESFDNAVLTSILEILDNVYEITSSGSLHWLMNITIKVAKSNDLLKQLASKFITLLTCIAEQFISRSNRYHLILRSRYGLYGAPLEPELFDVEPPVSPKGSATTLTYASVVAGENASVTTDFHTNYAFNKDHLDAKDVLLNLGDSKAKTKSSVNTTAMLRGLSETEPLHFVCISTSDGTRLERADAGSPSNMQNVVFNTVSQVANETKKTGASVEKTNSAVLGMFSNNDDKIVEELEEAGFTSELVDEYITLINVCGSEGTSNAKNSKCAEETLSPNKSLPWQQLLVMPPSQVIVVERMHSGARRFVTLDFGQPIVLTDVFMPYCSELLSVTIDIWLKGEDIDMQRLVLSTDIGTKNLLMYDLQPPPLCRYVKITAVGRYGMSSTRCRIPIANFYGHLIILPDEIPDEYLSAVLPPTNADLKKQLSVLSMLFEDVSCRYSLACSKLKNLLQPFLMSDTTNTAHLNAYMDIMKDKSTTFDNVKIFNAYQEAITYQKQLNSVRNVMCRIECALSKIPRNRKPVSPADVPMDKLRSIAEGLLETLLILDCIPKICPETCEKLFKGFCITQRSHIQFLAATVLDHSCRKKGFWGIFLSTTLAEMFSSNYTEKFPQDRVFILLAYLVKRCSERSIALDATLKVIAETLHPLYRNRRTLLGVTVDLSLLGWLLLFLSLQLDLSKNTMQNATRWDWVTGEIAGKINDTVNSSYKKKLRKKYLMYKQQLTNLDYNQKSLQTSTQTLSNLSSQAQHLTEKLELALNGPVGLIDKFKNIKKKEVKMNLGSSSVSGTLGSVANKVIGKRRREMNTDSSTDKVPEPQYIDGTHSLVVVKGLLGMLLSIDHSCSSDLFVLSCKVVARLVKFANMNMDEFLDEEKLLKLINLCTESELPFATHALACLLQDALDVGKTPTNTDADMMTPSTSWSSDILRHVENLCDSFEMEETFVAEPVVKQGKTTLSNSNHLPSVFESDDSEIEDFLEEIIERGRTILKKDPKTSLCAYGSSCAMDLRLDSSVETQAEVTLKRLVHNNSYTLLQNLNSPAEIAEADCVWPKWPEHLLEVIRNQPKKNIKSSTMLTTCFDMLFANLEIQSFSKIEHICQLWLTLNCQSDDKFNPSTNPFIALSNDAISSLIKAISWCPDLTLRAWCSALQLLTLMCNVPQISCEGNETDVNRLFGKTSVIINHPDFVQMFLRLLSGSAIQYCDRGLAGPGLCKAMHDLLVRLQMRCDVTNPYSVPGSKFKSHMLKVVYHMVQPSGPLPSKLGPLDAQCKLLQCLVNLNYNNADLNIALSILESTGTLVLSHVLNIERIKCVNIGERPSPTANSFSGIFASVLGGENHKQDKPVSWDILLIFLLKLLSGLVRTPLSLHSNNQPVEPMDTESMPLSQTDESKAEQIQQDPTMRNNHLVPCLADTILQHHPTIIRFCKALATCKTTSLSMIPQTYLGTQDAIAANLGESGTVGDAVFNVLSALARNASKKEFVMAPLLAYLSSSPQLSEPLIWFIIQILDTPEALMTFVAAGGVEIVCNSLIFSSNSPDTISAFGNVAMAMQHFIGHTTRTDASAIGVPSNTKKQQQASLENNLNLVNFAPQGTIKCSTSSTVHSPEILIQGGQASHRRARAPQWSYHFCPEEAHADLTITLPSAILLREVHIQPHQGTLATCPSAVSLEVSAYGPSRLVPACPPLPTSGMSFIRLHLPAPEVVNCVQIRLYKPRDASNIGLSQIRLLGTSAFGGNTKQQVMDLSEDDSHCKHSLGWLRLFYHCCTIAENTELENDIVAKAASIPELLSTCCGLLLVPTHIPALYLGNLEKVLCQLSLYSRENGLQTITTLLESRPNVSEPTMLFNLASGKLLMNSPGVQSACELLYRICSHIDNDTEHRVSLLLSWLKESMQNAIAKKSIFAYNSSYISIISSIIWDAKENRVNYDLESMITLDLFETVYQFSTLFSEHVVALKYAVDSLLCSLCFVKIEFFPLLLQKMNILMPNLSTDHGASISDDRKDSESMTDDSKQNFVHNYEWYERLIINDIDKLDLSNEVLDTVALVSRSPPAIQQLLDSRLPQLLNSVILDYCTEKKLNTPMSTLKNVTAILKFFSDICDEKLMKEWLGSEEGSQFWYPLLQYLCKGCTERKSNLRSAEHSYLEEICVRFLSKCCLCHQKNQALLAKVLCEVITQQTYGISGFLRRLILQLLLENEKIPVSIKADETLYKNSTVLHPYLPLHPAFKQTHDRALLYLGTNITIADILEHYISFSTSVKSEQSNLKMEFLQEFPKAWSLMSSDSDLSFAAGLTAKDKRAKDAKNWFTSTPLLKDKQFSFDDNKNSDILEGRVIRCPALGDEKLLPDLTLSQILKMITTVNGDQYDLSCLYLTISQNKGNKEEDIGQTAQQPIALSSILQVFSSMGGLALLAQHLPTVYPETVRPPPAEKPIQETSESDWIKVDGSDDIYEDIEEGPRTTTPTKSTNGSQNVPSHSLTAFALFLRLPGYPEVLLRDMKKALCLLRLVLGVTDDGEGADIFQSPVAETLPTLPFEILKKLFDITPLSTDDGTLLRRLSISTGVIHLLLACLGIFTHQTQAANGGKDSLKNKEEKPQLYWAKGTGFGTGSTQQSWNVEQALLKQRSEEEHVTVLLQVLSSYINPLGSDSEELAQPILPPLFEELLCNSALLPALSSYLRNDSVLDMARHIPLYRAVLELLRAMAISCQLVKLLLPQKNSTEPSVSSLLMNMKTCVDTYASKLRSAQSQKLVKTANNNKAPAIKVKYKDKTGEMEEMERDEGLAMLMPDIQLTADLVCNTTNKLMEMDSSLSNSSDSHVASSISQEQQYLNIMKKMQFDTFEMIQELPESGYKFVISHHFEGFARSVGSTSHPARVKRLAQEAVTLATSLPLSHSSSVFVRCDTDRLDIMKVLITGPSDTPYANGCFEFDVYFPPDYPLAPMMINLETTGHHSVRFNPNLYNDGKVCLSVLNTWHGRPEEKWNAQTSSFLQVLVSIQSLILVPEPYFNEPGYERSRGTPAGTQSSKEYNANIYLATVRWAMLEQLLNPCPCFKDVINAHFYIKRQEILDQCEQWIKELESENVEKKTNRQTNKRTVYTTLDSFKKVYDSLKGVLAALKPPEGMEETESSSMVDVTATVAQILSSIDVEKMVSDMCE